MSVCFQAILRSIFFSVLVLSALLAGCTTVAHKPRAEAVNGAMEKPDKMAKTVASAVLTASKPYAFDLASLKIQPLHPAKKWLQIGRYRVMSALPSEEQQDILQVMVQVTLPAEIQTLRSAIDYLLAKSGYQYRDSSTGKSLEVQALLLKSIPAVHRKLGPMTLQSVLEILVGKPFKLTIDPVHRYVSYELSPDFASKVPL